MKECPKKKCGLTYQCPGCKGEVVLTSRGESVVTVPQLTSSSSKSSTSATAPSIPVVAAAPARGSKRASTAVASSAPSAKTAKTGKEVSVVGKRYSSLSWFLGKPNPAPSVCDAVRASCAENALELQGGHVRKIDSDGFAVALHTGRTPKPLCGARQRLGVEWVDTDIQGLKVRRAQLPLKSRLSQVLWLVEDLERL